MPSTKGILRGESVNTVALNKVAVIGVGNMGAALVKGWLREGATDRVISVWDTFEPAVKKLLAALPGSAECSEPAGTSLSAAVSLEESVAAAHTVLVVVKPKDAREVLASIGRLARPEQTVVSAMAGLTLEWLREALGPGPTLMRIMPNLAVEVGAGAVAVAVEPGVDQAALQEALSLFRVLGLVEVLPEELFDVVTAVSGSSPAFLALAIEGLEDGAVAAGMSRADARRLVRQTALDTARRLTDLDDSPEALIEQMVDTGEVAKSTISSLEDRGLRSAFGGAVAAAMERSRQMRKI